MADNGGLKIETPTTELEYINYVLSSAGGREHLKPPAFWRKLDFGERKLMEVFRHVTFATGFRGATADGVAVVNIFRTSNEYELSYQLELVISLEESIHDFPSENLIAQIMLVAQ